MKRAILIGFVLAMASSSAYAWTEISNYKSKDGVSYKIKCQNGTGIGVTYTSGLMTYYVTSGSITKPYPSLDAAAKSGCNEAGYTYGSTIYFQATEQPSK
jgi:hypothetical protein